MKKIITIRKINSSIATITIIVSILVGFLIWTTSLITALLILLCAVSIPAIIDFLIIDPVTKLVCLIRRKIEV